MEFDNKIADLEKAIKSRKKDLKELESMYCDAQIARDNAKVTLITMLYMCTYSCQHMEDDNFQISIGYADRASSSRTKHGRVPQGEGGSAVRLPQTG